MGKIKRGGYLFYTWLGDHTPRHVHVYKDDKFVCKWDLVNGKVLKGDINNRILKALLKLLREREI